MKKITLLLMLLFITATYAQPSTSPSTPPDREAGDVISIYGGGNNGNPYTNQGNPDFFVNWGQPAPWNVPDLIDANGNEVLFYEGLSYQGLQLGTSLNAADMEFLHVDVWSPNDGTFLITPINQGTGPGEVLVEVAVEAGQWTSVDLSKDLFTGMTWDNVIQFKSETAGQGGGARGDFYIDNLYFFKEAADPNTDATLSSVEIDGEPLPGFAPGTTEYDFGVLATSSDVPQITLAVTANENATATVTNATEVPGAATIEVTAVDGVTSLTYTVNFVNVGPETAAPTPPEAEDANIISFYSEAYTQQPLNFDAGFCGGNSVEELQLNGNNTILYKFNACQGIQLNTPVDASSFTTLNFDYYINDGVDLTSVVLSLKLVATNGDDPDDVIDTALSIGSTPALETGKWVTLRINLNLTSFEALDEFVITAGTLSNNLYYDNVYLSGGTLSNDQFKAAEFAVYPNPTLDSWKIESKNANIRSVEIYNTLGRLVKTVMPNETIANIDASQLSSGIYFAKINSQSSNEQTIKLIKR